MEASPTAGMTVPREGGVQQADLGGLTTMLTFSPAPHPLFELANPREVKTFLPAWFCYQGSFFFFFKNFIVFI